MKERVWLVLPAVAALCLGVVALGASVGMHPRGGGADWPAALFPGLLAVALVSTMCWGVRAWRPGRVRVLLVAAALAHLLHLGAAGVMGVAFLREQHIFWSVTPLAALFWISLLGALVTSGMLWRASRVGSRTAAFFEGIAALHVALVLLVYAWTFAPPMQRLEGWIARSVYLVLHGR